MQKLRTKSASKQIIGGIAIGFLLASVSSSAQAQVFMGSKLREATSTKTSTKSSTKPKPASTKKPAPKKTTSTTSKYGYTGKKDPSDVTITPTLTTLTGSALGSLPGSFQLPAVASASKVLGLIQSDLTSANLDCQTLTSPLPDVGFSFAGSLLKDTVAACKRGDPTADGFYEFVLTDPAAVSKYDNADGVKNYLNYSSPETSSLASTYFTPSSKAILFTVGGQYAFDANEISWADLYNLGYQPPKR